MGRILVALMAAMAVCGAARAECRLEKYAELPLLMLGPRPLVPANINGGQALLLADSGAFFSMVSPQAADRLKLQKAPRPRNLAVSGVGGRIVSEVGVADTFDLGPLKLRKVQFLIAGDGFGFADGLLGQNVIGVRETEYDLAGGVIRLFQSKNCRRSDLAYWAAGQPVSVLELAPATPLAPHAIATARLNGRAIRVLFDTGAPTSILKLETAEMAGGRLEAALQAPTGGMNAAFTSRDTSIMRFDSLVVGRQALSSPRIRVGRVRLPGADMLLGADFFMSHRVLISKDQRKIYFTPNGRPFFDLAPPRPASPPTTVLGGGPPRPPSAAP